MLLTTRDAVLLLVDLQQRLVPALHDNERVVAGAVRLAEAAQLVGVPIRATEQNPDGLGPTVAPLAAYPRAIAAKTAFSATGAPDFPTLLPPGCRWFQFQILDGDERRIVETSSPPPSR